LTDALRDEPEYDPTDIIADDLVPEIPIQPQEAPPEPLPPSPEEIAPPEPGEIEATPKFSAFVDNARNKGWSKKKALNTLKARTPKFLQSLISELNISAKELPIRNGKIDWRQKAKIAKTILSYAPPATKKVVPGVEKPEVTPESPSRSTRAEKVGTKPVTRKTVKASIQKTVETSGVGGLESRLKKANASHINKLIKLYELEDEFKANRAGNFTYPLNDGKNAVVNKLANLIGERVKAQAWRAAELQSQAEREGTVYHYTLKENVPKIIKEGFKSELPPVFGTSANQKVEQFKPEDKIGGAGVLYFTTDTERWSKADVYVGENKGTKDYHYYDYENQKWVEEKNALKTVNLEPVKATISGKAGILVFDSLKKYMEFQKEHIGSAYVKDRLSKVIKKASELGYDVVNIKHTDKWKLKSGEDVYDEATGFSGKDDYFILNKDIINVGQQKQETQTEADISKEIISLARNANLDLGDYEIQISNNPLKRIKGLYVESGTAASGDKFIIVNKNAVKYSIERGMSYYKDLNKEIKRVAIHELVHKSIGKTKKERYKILSKIFPIVQEMGAKSFKNDIEATMWSKENKNSLLDLYQTLEENCHRCYYV